MAIFVGTFNSTGNLGHWVGWRVASSTHRLLTITKIVIVLVQNCREMSTRYKSYEKFNYVKISFLSFVLFFELIIIGHVFGGHNSTLAIGLDWELSHPNINC